MLSRTLLRNTVREANILGLPLVVWRGTSRQSYVADAYCPHMGAHLGVNGRVVKECIECPFHGWVFEGENGKCVEIPYSDSIPTSAKINLRKSVEMNGFIYLWYHAEGEEPTYYPREITEITSGALKYRGRAEFRVSATLQVTDVVQHLDLAENFGDEQHFTSLHSPSYLAGVNLQRSTLHDKIISTDWEATWRINEDPKLGHESFLTLNVLHRILSIIKFRMKSYGLMEGPGLVQFTAKALLGTSTTFFMLTPIDLFESRMTICFYSSWAIPQPFATLGLNAVAFQVDRDSAIWNRKTHLQHPVYTREDRTIKSFGKWYARFYSKTAVPPKYPETLEY